MKSSGEYSTLIRHSTVRPSGLAMGLIMLGTGNIKALEDMITYAHETQHEKSVRGLPSEWL